MVRLFAGGAARALGALLFVVVLCVSPVAGVTDVSAQDTGTAERVPDTQFVEATDSVSVWKNAPFPLRVNASASNGTVVENQMLTVRGQGAEVRLNKQQLAAFNPDEEIQMSFQSRYPITTRAFQNEEVQLLVAKAGPNASTTLQNTPRTSVGDALDSLMEKNASDDVSYELVDLGELEKGAIEASYDLSADGEARGPGQYTFFVVQDTEGEGFTVENGSLAVDGKARVLGMDVAFVQAAEASASVTTEDAAPGDEVTFDVNSTFTHSNVSHAVVLYNESQYTSARTRLAVDGPLTANVSSDQITVQSTLAGVSGTRRVVDNASVAGVSADNETVRGHTTFRGLADWIVEGANASDRMNGNAAAPGKSGNPGNSGDAGRPDNPGNSGDAGRPDNPGNSGGAPMMGEQTYLDASATLVASTNGTGTVDVQTGEDWEEGTYRYIYIGQAKGGNNVSTTTGTVELGNATVENDSEN
ncbi:collagen-like protein [Halogeometricum sp. S1BR25-6]|uniref:Collagen-like protein n=1 Tax=Halogeometricum salsisoli TaxID=2950536 RepID=A0ABU2GH83_9EURY|nr:collagen-like protein [Halogeometricum sp. S1BR25-6]MDS0300134.1 collagen-like protein [Halogeometricum sp. S1BR25-6]